MTYLMLDALNNVAAAVEIVYGENHNSALITVKGGRAFADSSRLSISTPVPTELEFVCNGHLLLKAFKSLGTSAGLRETKNFIVAETKSKRRVQVKKTENLIEYPQVGGDKIALPAGLAQALRLVLPFMSTDKTREAFNGVRLTRGNAYATNNVCIAAAAYDKGAPDVCLPDFLAGYIASREDDPTHVSISPNSICLWYDDGTEVRSLRMAQEMPSQVMDVLETKWKPCEFQVTDQWREAAKFVISESDNKLYVETERIYAEKSATVAEQDIATPVAERLSLTTSFFSSVLECSTAFDFGDAKAISFSGERITGCMAGRIE